MPYPETDVAFLESSQNILPSIEDGLRMAMERAEAEKLSVMMARVRGSGDSLRDFCRNAPLMPARPQPESFVVPVCYCHVDGFDIGDLVTESRDFVGPDYQTPSQEGPVHQSQSQEGSESPIGGVLVAGKASFESSGVPRPTPETPIDGTTSFALQSFQPIEDSPVDPVDPSLVEVTPAVPTPNDVSSVDHLPTGDSHLLTPGAGGLLNSPVVNCPLVEKAGSQGEEHRIPETQISIPEGVEAPQQQECAVVQLPQGPSVVHVAAVQQSPLVALRAVKEEVSGPKPSNVENPIVIDSDDEDELYKKKVLEYPTDVSSELSEGEADDTVSTASDKKLSQSRALRIQLRTISKKKLAVNRANRLKSRELEMQNRKLRQELELQQKKLEEAEETIRSAGLSQVISTGKYTDSPSTPLPGQATTSIASAPELSGSEVRTPRNRPPAEEVIPSTQVR